MKVKTLSRVRLLVTPWTAAYQAPPSMGFSRQEYWSGLPLPSPRRVLMEKKDHLTWLIILEIQVETTMRNALYSPCWKQL